MFNVTSRTGIKSGTPRSNKTNIPQSTKSWFGGNRSLQTSMVMEETQLHVLESCASTPVQVTEVLGTTKKLSDVYVQLSASGWAWLVCGRRLLIWHYKPSRRANAFLSCRELVLPPSDVAHRAQLVTVWATGSGPPACLAVSPEGIVRYWASIAREGSSIEISVDLHGEECFSVCDVPPLGCLLATTTSTIMLLQATLVSGQQTVLSRSLKAPQGLLGGISRRVSSLFFTSMPQQSGEAKLIKVLSVAEEDGSGEWVVYILSGAYLKKWIVSADGQDRMVYECDVHKLANDNFTQTYGGYTPLADDSVWLVDMQLHTQGLVILTASLSPTAPTNIHYALGVLETERNSPPLHFSSWTVLKFSTVYRDNEDFLQSRLIQVGTASYVYNTNTIVTYLDEGMVEDVISLHGRGNRIQGAGVCDDRPLFFSTDYGIITVVSSQSKGQTHFNISMADSTFLETSALLGDSLMGTGNVEKDGGSDFEDKKQKLKKAFLSYCKKNMVGSGEVISTLFPRGGVEVDSALDLVVLSISNDIIDDYPASDPRWVESLNTGVGVSSSSTSLILLQQLEDKQKAHSFYIAFLKSQALWDKLFAITLRGSTMLTSLALGENAEKLVAAIAVHRLQATYCGLIETGINKVTTSRGGTPSNQLTPMDVFYREVSGIGDILVALLEAECGSISLELNSRDLLTTITNVNHIILSVFQEVLEFRGSMVSTFSSDNSQTCDAAEYVSWVATAGDNGMRTLLIKQHSMILETALGLCEDTPSRSSLYQQLLDITDIILDGYRCQITGTNNDRTARRTTTMFHKDRYNLIHPLVVGCQYSSAAALAEKYEDFTTLVELCDREQDQGRLNNYLHMFKHKGFEEFVYAWHWEQRKMGTLLRSGPTQAGLGDFLTQRKLNDLLWLQQVNTQDYQAASQTLKHLAFREDNLLARKKTLLSISSLCARIADDTECIEELSRERELVLHQHSLPASVLEACGVDADTMKVFSPRQLIDLYIGEDNGRSNEYDFKKALDLLSYLEEEAEDMEDIKLQIWCRCILKDMWSDLDTDNWLASCRQTLFFKTIELIHMQGGSVLSQLSSMEEIMTCNELGELKENTTFQFLLSAGYEHLQATINQ